jgi:hypothetical protein
MPRSIGLHMWAISSCAALAAATGEPAVAVDQCPGQDVTVRQTTETFTSITDGQPGAPRSPQLTAILSYDQAKDQFQSQFSMSGTPGKYGFLCQAEFSLDYPTLDIGDGLVSFERSITGSWQQRWRIDDGRWPTISTVFAVEVPYGEHNRKTDISLTAVVAKTIGADGVGYLNVYAHTVTGAGAGDFSTGALIGYKRILTRGFSLIGDLVYDEGGLLSIETAAQWDFKSGLTIGPGVRLTQDIDHGAGLDVAAGVVVFRAF